MKVLHNDWIWRVNAKADFIIISSAERTSAVYEQKPWERKKRDKVRDRRRQWRQATEREREREREGKRRKEKEREKRPALEAPAPRINPQQSTFQTLPDETAQAPNSEQQRPIASSSGAEWWRYDHSSDLLLTVLNPIISLDVIVSPRWLWSDAGCVSEWMRYCVE
jgi:hypothetical protein